jgi:hypothetical protein
VKPSDPRAKARRRDRHHVEAWNGGYRRYDIVKEFVIAAVVVSILTAGLAWLFGSPDEKPATLARWANAAPADFLATSVSELDHTSEVAQYGPPYTTTPGAAQKIGPVCLQCVPGVRIPIDTAKDFVLDPLSKEALIDPTVRRAIAMYEAASPSERRVWTGAYGKALDHVTFVGGRPLVSPGDYGPVPTIMTSLLNLARSGGLDGALLSTKQFYETNYTKPILYLSGGSYFEDLAKSHHLLGTQWGMMNETGNWPGQAWLWLYTMWYQVPPFSTSGNADAEIWVIMMVQGVPVGVAEVLPGGRARSPVGVTGAPPRIGP